MLFISRLTKLLVSSLRGHIQEIINNSLTTIIMNHVLFYLTQYTVTKQVSNQVNRSQFLKIYMWLQI